MNIGEQIAFLFILAIPIASIAWTVTLGNHPKAANDNHLKTGQRAD
jgi:hypothetical protein